MSIEGDTSNLRAPEERNVYGTARHANIHKRKMMNTQNQSEPQPSETEFEKI